MKVTVYYSAAPDAGWTTAYLDDEPGDLGAFKGHLKHGACEEVIATWSGDRQRFEIVWREPFNLENYL